MPVADRPSVSAAVTHLGITTWAALKTIPVPIHDPRPRWCTYNRAVPLIIGAQARAHTLHHDCARRRRSAI
jgi:hypothetical protein